MEHEWRELSMYRTHDLGLDCCAALSVDSATREAYVFVHGFLGKHDPRPRRTFLRLGEHERGTWRGFASLIDSDSRFEAVDCYFVGYPSFRASTAVSAARLLKFIETQLTPVQPDNQDLILNYINDPTTYIVRAQPKRYSKLTLVGHSEGGLVIRKAVVRSAQSTCSTKARDLVNSARLRLFASAQGGSRLAGGSESAMDFVQSIPAAGSVTKALRALHPKGTSPAYFDMTGDSLGLSQTITESAELPQWIEARSASTLWALNDRVVESVDYRHDVPGLFLHGVGHADVCKPDQGRALAIMNFLFDEVDRRPDLYLGAI